MSATAVQSDPAQLNVFGHYNVSDEPPVLVGRRIEGEVFVYDYPATATVVVISSSRDSSPRWSWQCCSPTTGDRPSDLALAR